MLYLLYNKNKSTMATRKTRTVWQSIKHYLVITFITVLTSLSVIMIYIFAGLFDFQIWHFLMGILAGIIIKVAIDKK